MSQNYQNTWNLLFLKPKYHSYVYYISSWHQHKKKVTEWHTMEYNLDDRHWKQNTTESS